MNLPTPPEGWRWALVREQYTYTPMTSPFDRNREVKSEKRIRTVLYLVNHEESKIMIPLNRGKDEFDNSVKEALHRAEVENLRVRAEDSEFGEFMYLDEVTL